MIDILIYLAVFVIVVILIWYVLSQLPLPEPLGQILRIVLVVIGGLILVALLLNFVGHPIVPMRL